MQASDVATATTTLGLVGKPLGQVVAQSQHRNDHDAAAYAQQTAQQPAHQTNGEVQRDKEKLLQLQ